VGVSKLESDFALHVSQGVKPTEAMRLAGYAEATIKTYGAKFLFRRPRVRRRIAELRGEAPEKGDGLYQKIETLNAHDKKEFEACTDGFNGLLYWLENYVWTWDKANKKQSPYPMWKFQKQFLKELNKGGKILLEKSRDLMVTWTVCEYMLWHEQFDPFWSGFATSRREAEVDNGGGRSTTTSIFGRIRFSYDRQPEWMKMNLRFGHLKIVNMEPGMIAEIAGESANPNVGRSSDVYFKWGDEFALVEQSEKAHASMMGGGFHTLLYTSTSNLTGNEFFRLRSRPDSGFRVLTYTWKDRPDRDKKWYKEKASGMTEEQRAKELDIKYELTGPNRVWPDFDPRLHIQEASKLPAGVGRAAIGFDEGFANPGAMYYARYYNDSLYILDEIYKARIQPVGGSGQDWLGYIKELEDKHGPVEAISIGHESQTLESLLTSHGYTVYRVGKDLSNRIRLIARLLATQTDDGMGLMISEECTKLLWEMPRYHWRTIRGVRLDKPYGEHDHACTAIQALAEYFLEASDDEVGDWESEW